MPAECTTATTDIANDRQVLFHEVVGGVRRTAVQQNAARPSAQFRYAQFVEEDTGLCTASKVYAAQDIERLNPRHDLESGLDIWRDCDGGLANGHEINIHDDIRHCGGCGIVADNGHACTTDDCAAGVIQRDVVAGTCFIPQSGVGSCYTYQDMQPVTYGAEPSTTRNFCRSCTAANPTDWTVANGNACCTGGEPNKDAFEKGYRPAVASGNIRYTEVTGQHAVLQAPWIARISEVQDRDNWTYSNMSTCNANQSGRGPFRLSAYLNGLADQEDWYVFRHTDLAVNKSGQQSEPRVRVVAPAGQMLELCVYVACVDKDKGNVRGKPLNALGYYFSRPASASTTESGPNRAAAGSPLSLPGSVGFAGRCKTSATPDMEVLLEDYSAAQASANQCWHVDVFASVRPSSTPQYSDLRAALYDVLGE